MQVVPKSYYIPYQKQYPLKPEAVKGLTPTFEQLRKGMKRSVTLLFFSKEGTSTDWRMVMDLQGVNNSVIPRTSCVPDPHTLLNQLKSENAYFTVIDLANAFFSIPIHPDSQGWFGFTFLGQKWTYSHLAQGYLESPTIYSQAITRNLGKFDPPRGSQILIHVDDILLSNSLQEACKADTLARFLLLADQGHKVNKRKLQLWQEQVIYLGHTITQEGRTLNSTRKTAILEAPKPLNKKQKMSFLGIIKYCRAWVPHFPLHTGLLSDLIYGKAMTAKDKIVWTREAEKQFVAIKQLLISDTVLAFPRYDRVFTQTVDCSEGFMTSVLTYRHGGKNKPVAYYSSRLDQVAQAMPLCLLQDGLWKTQPL